MQRQTATEAAQWRNSEWSRIADIKSSQPFDGPKIWAASLLYRIACLGKQNSTNLGLLNVWDVLQKWETIPETVSSIHDNSMSCLICRYQSPHDDGIQRILFILNYALYAGDSAAQSQKNFP